VLDPAFDIPAPLMATIAAAALGWNAPALAEWFGVVRTIMMVLGGIVVVAIVLIVAVAITSGVMGMLGRLRKTKN
jgi:hypothetical protein